MSYTPPIYPGEIPTLANLFDYTDDIDWITTDCWDAIKKELKATMDELGTDPAGDYSTVKARLEALADATKVTINNILNGMRIAINGSLSIFKILDGFIDCFFDESGVDTGDSSNQDYDADNDYYAPTGGFAATMKLYLQCNGDDESQSFPDESASNHTVTAENNAQVDTAQKVFGTGSAYFPDTSDYLSIPDSDDFAPGSGDFCFRVRVRFDTVANGYIVSQYDGVTDAEFSIFFESNHLNVLNWNGTSWAFWFNCSWSPSVDTWYALEVSRTDGTCYVFIDGVSQELSFDIGDGSETMYNVDAPFWLNHSATGGIAGWYDEIRWDLDGGHTSNYTPATSEFSAGRDNMMLISENQEAESQPDSVRLVALMEEVDSITINTDLKAYASRDDGANYVQGTLVDKGDFDGDKKILYANADVSSQASDKTIRWKYTTHNEKNLKLHAVGARWD